MSLTYAPLWKMLDDLKINKMDFAKKIDISSATLAKLGKNEPVTLTIIDKICTEFHCKIEDVVRYVPTVLLAAPKFHISTGMIVLGKDMENPNDLEKVHTQLPDGTTRTLYKAKESVFVVLDILSPDLDTDPHKIIKAKSENLFYIVAPIAPINSRTLLSSKFQNVEINGEKTDGTILFGKAKTVHGSIFEKCIGYMPKSYMQKYKKIIWNMINSINEC